MTKKIVLTLLAAAATATAGTQALNAQDYVEGGLQESSVSASTTYASQSVWRGVSRGEDYFQFSVLGDVELANGFTVFSGASYYSTDEVTDEFVFTGGLVKNFADAGLAGTNLGVLFNYYSEGSDESGVITSEVGIRLSQDFDNVMIPFNNLSITQYLTTEGNSQGYGVVEATETISILNLPIDITASLGYLADVQEYTHAQLLLSTDIQTAVDGLTVSPFVSYTASLGDGSDGLEGMYISAKNEAAVGLRATYNF